jgi:hypothetical protein
MCRIRKLSLEHEQTQSGDEFVRKYNPLDLEWRSHVPIPLLVDLLEVDAVADDAAAAGEEEHVAVGAPQLVGECAEGEEGQQ